MKEAKFIELLNLYVDREISPEEAAQLEAEIAHSSERRKIYVQYCRMHRASTVLFASFKSGASPSGSKLAEAAQSADDKVLAFPEQNQKRSWGWAYGASIAAAAACFAFVVTHRSDQAPTTAKAQATLVAQQTAPVVRKALPPMKAVSIAASSEIQQGSTEYRPVFVSQALGNRERIEQDEITLASRRVDLDWVKRVQVQPLRDISQDELVFENKPMQVQDLRVFGPQRQTQGKTEMGAFQFEK